MPHTHEEPLEEQLADLAARGDSDAAFELAYHYQYDHEDPETAERFYRVAIEAGDLNAPNNLGGILRRAERWDEAEAMFRRGMEGGDDVAAVNLAALLRRRDRDDEAQELLERTAEDGSAEAMETLARWAFDREDWERSEHWFRRAVETDGDERPEAITCVGVLLDMRDEDEEAERWLRRGLDLGDAHAAYHLGMIARRRDDLDEAIRLLRIAADELGDGTSVNQLAVTLERRGDRDEAATLYERAARDGYVPAARNLGLLHGDRGDDAGEREWLARAAEAGDERAGELLAHLDQEPQSEAAPKQRPERSAKRGGLLGRLPRPW